MTRYLAVTTCNAEQWQAHGIRMVDTFTEFWDPTIRLWIYAENWGDNDLYEAAPWLAAFKKRYRDQRYNGGPGGRDYRHDAVRFAHKIAAIGAAADAYCDVLIWIDADVITHAPVTRDWLDSLFPEPAILAWLDRDNCYPECGFMMFRMPAARPLIEGIVEFYRSGLLFNLPEWHDSYVIQHVVKVAGIKPHSLSGEKGRKHIGHPWVMSPLATRMDHLKGERRKARGRSLPGDLIEPRPEPYWQ